MVTSSPIFEMASQPGVPNTALLPNDGETIAESLSSLTERDVVVVFAIRRLVPLVRAALSLLPQLKARSLLIVDQHYRKPLKPTWLLRCVTTAPRHSTTTPPSWCCATSWQTNCFVYAEIPAGID